MHGDRREHEPGSLLKGYLSLLAAAFLFALSSAFIKIAASAPYSLSPFFILFVFFAAGTLLWSVPVIRRGRIPRAHRVQFVVLRGLFNVLSMALFYAALASTTITKANLLNLTYPVYVFLLAPLINHEKTDRIDYLFLIAALTGAWLVVGGRGGGGGINAGDLYALLSGIAAAAAITTLREARKGNRAPLVLWYQMVLGCAVSGLLALAYGRGPAGSSGMGLVAVSAGSALLGQASLTYGYRYIDAARGSLVLSTGIVFGAMFGIGMFQDPVTASILSGGGLIVLSLAGMFVRHFRAYKKKVQW